MNKWLEIEHGAWKYTPFCVEKPCDHNAKVGDDDSKYHICILHTIYGYAFYSNTEKRNEMTKEEMAKDFASDINIEVSFDEMREIAILRLKYKLDMIGE